ncbi:hypothetical protein J6U76_04635 [bacterium]|nr:hypothetical protein [bacterium]
MEKKEVIIAAKNIPALQRIIGIALHRVSKPSSSISYKEYIDCGSWTSQA